MKRLIAWVCTLCIILGCTILPQNASAYSKAYPLPTLTGNQAQDTANIALSQIGYSGSGGTIYGAWWNQVTNWGVDYTNSMWCAMFACWCANQAGAGLGIAYDKNAAAVPNLLSWLEKNATVDKSYSMIPRAGDFIFFSGHVGIVTGYNSSTKNISFVAGNEGYSPGYVGKGTCGWWSGAKYGNQPVIAIGRPNYKNITPVVPAKTTPYTDSSTYSSGSSVKIKWNTVSGATYYWINIYKDKKQIVSKDIGNTSSYTLSAAEPGSYEVCIEALNSAGTSGAKSCYFVVSPSKTTPYTDSSTYTTGSSIKIKWNAVSGASSYWINIYRDGHQIISKDIGNVTSYVLSSSDTGSYEVCIEALNSGGTSGAKSCYFIVTPPTVIFNANGGTLPSANASHPINGINVSRGHEELIVYNQSGTTTGTNKYGREFAFDAQGKLTTVRGWGDDTQIKVPAGGFILSAQVDGAAGSNAGNFLIWTSTDGWYWGYDSQRAYAYDNLDAYLCHHKTIKNGSTYGTLPTINRDGYSFDGWYTSATGGTKVTSSTKVTATSDHTLYAHWTKIAEEPVVPPVTPEPTPPTTTTEFHFPRVAAYTQGQFTDVPPAQWFTANVANAVEFGLMKGNSASTFNPYGDVTLAEAITMAARIHAIYTTGTESFDQSSGGKWYQVYLDYAYENGIIGNSYYTRDVTKKATRAQYTEIFANSLPDKGLEARNQVADNAIPDVPMSQSYADSVYKLYRAGILTGGDVLGTFSPKTYITRAESATIVARMADTDNRKNFTLTTSQSLTLKEYGGVWHSSYESNGMPREELIIHDITTSGKVIFSLSCYRLYNWENVQGTLSNNTASFNTSDPVYFSGYLSFDAGTISITVDSSEYTHIPDGTKYVFQVRSNESLL